MKAGWTEVARLGIQGEKYPHVLIDAHGWCIRWGPKFHHDDKYYSNLSSVLRGLSEHGVRRTLTEGGSPEGIKSLLIRIDEALVGADQAASRFLEKLGFGLQPILQDWRKARTMRSAASNPPAGGVVEFPTGRRMTGNQG